MYHLHFTIYEKEDNKYYMYVRQKTMYEIIESINMVDDIIIYNDFKFTESDINFMKNDIVSELKKNNKVYDNRMKYMDIRVKDKNNEVILPSIKYDNRIIIETNDLDVLLNQLYGLSDFYQMMYKYKPLSLPEPEINMNSEDEEEEIIEDEDYDSFQYY